MMATPSPPPVAAGQNRCRLYFHAGQPLAALDIKSISLLSNVLLRQAATEAGGAEVLLFRNGFLTEGRQAISWSPVEASCSLHQRIT
jgi:branched-subunit amino acid aminotransferase/4-amino-4-deoxychorismate lyase